MVRGKHTVDGLMANGVEKSDTLNLLDSTDSDVEWLSLPPLKGKKPKKKKSTKAQKEPECSLWTFMKIFLQFTVVGVIVLLCVACVWLTSQLTDVSKRLEKFENRNLLSTGDLERLVQQVSAVNRSLDLHGKTLDTLITNMSSVNSMVNKLASQVDHVTQGLELAPELKQMPQKLVSFSQSLASLGADVSGMKDIMATFSPFMKSSDEKIEKLTTQVQEISAKVSPNTPTDTENNVVNPEMANEMQKLSQQINDVNSTIFTHMATLIKSNGLHDERLTQLENITQQLTKTLSSISTEHTSISSDHASMTDDYTSDEFRDNVINIIQSLGLSGDHAPSKGNVTELMANITTVLNNLKEVEAKYKTLETQLQPGDETGGHVVTLEMFQSMGNIIHGDVENLNASFIKLKGDVSAMSDMLTKQANSVTNLTFQVEATKVFMATLQKKLESSGWKVPVTPTGEVFPGSETKTTETVKETAKPTTEKPVAGSSSTGNQTTASPEHAKVTVEAKPAVSVPRIKNYDDLELNFYRWDLQSSGQINPDILPDFLGPYSPSDDVLKPFDEDHNGLYSLKELAKAFGFTMPSTTETSFTRTETTPPR